jgi:hypothetical protein
MIFHNPGIFHFRNLGIFQDILCKKAVPTSYDHMHDILHDSRFFVRVTHPNLDDFVPGWTPIDNDDVAPELTPTDNDDVII